ncbi:TPA: hypothetical protein DCE37_13960 [Candidatus Latescibacteria bacterium]|nr:hypothetical protein [Candidatus Latescibacterota bacterium]
MEEHVAFKEGEKWGYRRPDGSVAIEPRFDSAGGFSEGFARVRIARLWGYINAEGVLVIQSKFEQARHFAGGVAKVKHEGKWGLIDRYGNWVDSLDAETFLDDRGQFISKDDHESWEKPPGQADEKEGE